MTLQLFNTPPQPETMLQQERRNLLRSDQELPMDQLVPRHLLQELRSPQAPEVQLLPLNHKVVLL